MDSKTDANGVKQWDKRFGGTNTNGDYLRSLQQTTDGGYILGGYTYSGIGGDKTEDSRGGYDYWIVKTDANGVKQWDKRFGGSSTDYLYSLQQTTDGGYILGGVSGGGIGGDKTEAGRGFTDYWIVKTDANGVKQWDKTYGGSDPDDLTSLQQTTDGGYILGGTSSSGIGSDKTEDSRGYNDYWIVKTDANGVKQWDKRFGGSDLDNLYSLQQTTDGGYILGGASYSGIGGDKTQASRGGNDYWIVKTDANGVKQWDKRFGGNYNDFLLSLQQTTDGGYILGGESASGIGGNKTQGSRGGYDYWIVKLGCPPDAVITPQGNLDICQTDSVVLTANWVDGFKYKWIKDGNAIPGANRRSYTATEPGIYKVKIHAEGGECRKYSKEVTVINSCGKIANTLSLFPNPTKGIVTVTYNSNTADNVQLRVYDKTGKLMFTKTERAIKGSNTYQINFSNLINGMYNLQVNNGSEQSQVKFVIEK